MTATLALDAMGEDDLLARAESCADGIRELEVELLELDHGAA